jgi:hypothetical protein
MNRTTAVTHVVVGAVTIVGLAVAVLSSQSPKRVGS